MKTYYRVKVDINLDAIYNNIENTRKIINKETKIMAIVKADAYGHGAVAVAKTIDNLVDAYGVAIVEEAIELRKAGITKPILILGVTNPMQYHIVVEHNISQTIFRYDDAKILDQEAKKQGKKASVHIKIDTGMGRIGYMPCNDSINEINKIFKLNNITVEGIFSHFACADEKSKISANNQLRIFDDFITQLEAKHIYIKEKHISNSAGIIDMPYANKNIVRSGISTYGLYPSEEVDKTKLILKSAMSIKSYITYIKKVPKDTPVSYGSTFITSKDTLIATIPVGYADGYPRQLSSKGRVLINGKSAPIIGRVCMDQFMVDITDIDNVHELDEVVILGECENDKITVEELASLAGSFNYEFICDIGKRIPRVYYKNNKQVGTFDYYECTQYALNLDK